MDAYWTLPELRALRTAEKFIRIPTGVDVPITSRIQKLIDTSHFRRLSNLSQLGLVALVYPGARHTRFEHSLGVYRNALLFLERLTQSEDFRSRCSPKQCELFLVAALLHDIGHYPFAHAIEDMRLPGMPRHEELAAECLQSPDLKKILECDFEIDPNDVLELLAPAEKPGRFPLLFSMLSGPIDIDKLDYLERDSMHAGVPYGRNFDQQRLIGQLCVDTDRNSLAITQKARTAAEMMVFARYVMFSEVYWHHAVRSATAMLQRCVYGLNDRAEFLAKARWMSDAEAASAILEKLADTELADISRGLFGQDRSLFKRAAQFDYLEAPEIHRALARRPFEEMVELSGKLAEYLSSQTKQTVLPSEILIDAPPTKLEVQFDVRVRQSDETFRPLGTLSPVVQTLATHQFDNMVKRVRIFVAPKHRDWMRQVQWREAFKRTGRPDFADL